MITINSAGTFTQAVTRGSVKIQQSQPEFKLPTADTETEQKSIPKAPEPSYDVTDEEAEHFRKKYGENYDEDIVHKLYYELVDKGIISRNAACEASGSVGIIPLSALKSVTYAGSGEGYGLEMYMDMDLGFFSNMMFIKDICRTDKDAYKSEWDKFQEEYYREKATWRDYLRETLDFEMYLKENSPGGSAPVQEHFDDVIAGLENTLSVIDKIFGTEPSYTVSEQQAAYLSVRYDLSNMPEGSEQEKNFLDELVKLNIISDEDARLWNFNCGGPVQSVSGSLYVRPYDGGEISGMPMWQECRVTSDNIIDRLMGVIETQKNINEYYGENVGGDDFLDSKERLLTVLIPISSQIVDKKSSQNRIY